MRQKMGARGGNRTRTLCEAHPTESISDRDLPAIGSDGNRTLDLLVGVENTGDALPFDQTRIPRTHADI